MLASLIILSQTFSQDRNTGGASVRPEGIEIEGESPSILCIDLLKREENNR
jgi:hypothetical protein